MSGARLTIPEIAEQVQQQLRSGVIRSLDEAHLTDGLTRRLTKHEQREVARFFNRVARQEKVRRQHEHALRCAQMAGVTR